MSLWASINKTGVSQDPSIFSGSGTDYVEPSLSEVLSAYGTESYKGLGTAYADIVASGIEQKKQTGVPLTEEEYKQSPNYRPDISYDRDMTDSAAQALATYSDERKKNAEIISSATGLQSAVGMAYGFVAGIFEPKNVAYGVATSVALTPIAGWLAPAGSSLRRVMMLKKALGNYGTKAAIGGAEGMVGAALAEPSNMYTAGILKQDYTMADSLLNISMSAAFGAGFNVVPSYIADKWRKHGASAPDIVAHELDVATSQMIDGQRINVEHVELSKLQSDLRTISQKIAAVSPEEEANLIPRLQEYINDNRDRISSYEGGDYLLKVNDRLGEYRANIDALTSELKSIKQLSELTPTQALDPETAGRISSIDEELTSTGLKAKRRQELLREKRMLEEGGAPLPENQIAALEAVKQAEASRTIAINKKIKGQEKLLLKKEREFRQLTRDAINHVNSISDQMGSAVTKSISESPNLKNNTLVEEAEIKQFDDRYLELKDNNVTGEKEYQDLLNELTGMKNEGLVSEEELLMLKESAGSIKESDMKAAYDSLLICMTRG